MAKDKTPPTLENYIRLGHVRYMPNDIKLQLKNLAPGCRSGNSTEHMFWVKNNIKAYPRCEGCNKELNSTHWKPFLKPEQRIDQNISSGYMRYCGKSCAYTFGTKQESYKNTCLSKYGVEHPMKTDHVIAKIKANNIDKHGDAHPFKWSGEKFLAVLEQKHGTRVVRHIDGVHDKILNTINLKTIELLPQKIREMEDIFEAKCISEIPTEFRRVDEVDLTWRHVCGKTWVSNISARGIRSCPSCWSGTSKAEQEVATFIETFVPVEQHDRKIIFPKELDIFIPGAKLAIEFDGTYWHSAKFEPREKCVQKLNMCEAQGVRLITIQEHLWVNKQELVKDRIRSILGKNKRIGARKTQVKNIDSVTASNFLLENHLQGAARSSIQLGLFSDNVLIMVATFAKPRWSNKADWELIRMATSRGITVQGGASKLIHHFRQNNSGTIISYADRCWSQGNVYKSIGFEFSHNTAPSYWWVHHTCGTFSRYQTQKSKLKTLLSNCNKQFYPELSEEDNMKQAGFIRLYDRGNSVFLLRQ